jgi:hypothetical protein
MAQYRLADQARAEALDGAAQAAAAAGNHAAVVGDDYIRITVFLAAVLFLVGIGSTFKLPTVRYVLICVGAMLTPAGERARIRLGWRSGWNMNAVRQPARVTESTAGSSRPSPPAPRAPDQSRPTAPGW